jgi:hypothetical protein
MDALTLVVVVLFALMVVAWVVGPASKASK